jgi:hypothetical protein
MGPITLGTDGMNATRWLIMRWPRWQVLGQIRPRNEDKPTIGQDQTIMSYTDRLHLGCVGLTRPRCNCGKSRLWKRGSDLLAQLTHQGPGFNHNKEPIRSEGAFPRGEYCRRLPGRCPQPQGPCVSQRFT